MDKKITGGRASAKKLDVDKAYHAARDKLPEKRKKNASIKDTMPSGTLLKPNGEAPRKKVSFAEGMETRLENRTHLGQILDAHPEQNALSTVLDEVLGEKTRAELNKFIEALGNDGTPGKGDVFDAVIDFWPKPGDDVRLIADWGLIPSGEYERKLDARFAEDPSGINRRDLEKIQSQLAMFGTMITLVNSHKSKHGELAGLDCYLDARPLHRDHKKDVVCRATSSWLQNRKAEDVMPLMRFLQSANDIATSADTPQVLKESSFFRKVEWMLETVESYSPPE